MAEPNQNTFQMHGCRASVLPVAAAFEPQVQAIEDSIQRVPEFAFDLSKLLRETTQRLSLLPRNHPNAGPARESIEKTIRGLLQTIQGLCELRNNFGMASHGRDVNAARMEQRQATLAAQAADTIAAFLYRIHRDALADQPASRVYYEDHADFNQWLDEEFDPVTIGLETLAPSEVLFHTAINGYKLALTEFLNAPPSEADDGGAE